MDVSDDQWVSLSSFEKISALCEVVNAIARKHPFASCVIVSLVLCNIIPVSVFVAYLTVTAVFVFSIAAIAQCKLMDIVDIFPDIQINNSIFSVVIFGFGMCILLPCIALMTLFGLMLSVPVIVGYLLWEKHVANSGNRISSIIRKER